MILTKLLEIIFSSDKIFTHTHTRSQVHALGEFKQPPIYVCRMPTILRATMATNAKGAFDSYSAMKDDNVWWIRFRTGFKVPDFSENCRNFIAYLQHHLFNQTFSVDFKWKNDSIHFLLLPHLLICGTGNASLNFLSSIHIQNIILVTSAQNLSVICANEEAYYNNLCIIEIVI